MAFNLNDYITVFLTIFAIIDIVGSIPVLINIKKKQGHIHSEKVVIFVLILLLVFLFLGENLLKLVGVDLASFAIAGAIVIFIIGLEMIIGREIMKSDSDYDTAEIVPIAFPLIAGAGTITTVISLKAAYSNTVIFTGIFLNLVLVYIILKLLPYIEGKVGKATINVLRRIFGVLLIAISVKIFTTNIASIFKTTINF
ncbi:MAG: MarC family protein [Saprospiraceae bacterium]|nr:MarC family protein [Saprospiraceae bacterium]